MTNPNTSTVAPSASRQRAPLPPSPGRPSNGRAIIGLCRAIVLRLLREGLVVRALAWPGLVTALTLFLSAAITIAVMGSPLLYVGDADLVAPFEAKGFRVKVDPSPSAALKDGKTDYAVWREDDHTVLGITFVGTISSRMESVLRDFTGARWRLEVPATPTMRKDSKELQQITSLLGGVVGLLFALYGVVIGAGSLYRDRSSGVLESDLALAVPRWVHAAGRLLAIVIVLGPALAISLSVTDSVIAIHKLGHWMFDDFVAIVVAGSLGIAFMARAKAGGGFSGPLSQALTLTMALVSLGSWHAEIGRFFPLVSLGSALANHHSSWTTLPIAVLIAVAVAWDFHRRECL